MVTRKGVGAAALAFCLGLGGMIALGSAQPAAAKPKPKAAAKSPAKPKPAPAKAPAAAVAPSTGGIGRICVEAESGKITAPVALYKDPAGCEERERCSGGQGIEVPEGVDHDPKTGEALPTVTGDATLSLNVKQEGLYQLWARVWWSDGCGNSFRISVDDGGQTLVSGGNYKRWYWAKGPQLRLTAGKHKLIVHNSEDGTRMDQIYLTTDFKYVPVRREKPTQ